MATGKIVARSDIASRTSASSESKVRAPAIQGSSSCAAEASFAHQRTARRFRGAEIPARGGRGDFGSSWRPTVLEARHTATLQLGYRHKRIRVSAVISLCLPFAPRYQGASGRRGTCRGHDKSARRRRYRRRAWRLSSRARLPSPAQSFAL